MKRKNLNILLYIALSVASVTFTSCGANEDDIATKTFNSGYVHLFFKQDNSVEIYQASSGSYARGCAASATWAIEDGKLRVSNVESYCSTRSYSNLNGQYSVNGDCIVKGDDEYCN